MLPVRRWSGTFFPSLGPRQRSPESQIVSSPSSKYFLVRLYVYVSCFTIYSNTCPSRFQNRNLLSEWSKQRIFSSDLFLKRNNSEVMKRFYRTPYEWLHNTLRILIYWDYSVEFYTLVPHKKVQEKTYKVKRTMEILYDIFVNLYKYLNYMVFRVMRKSISTYWRLLT